MQYVTTRHEFGAATSFTLRKHERSARNLNAGAEHAVPELSNFRIHQLAVTGLDGGTYSVSIEVPEIPGVFFSLATAQADATVYELVKTATAVKVDLADVGEEGAPVIGITSVKEGL